MRRWPVTARPAEEVRGPARRLAMPPMAEVDEALQEL